MQKKKTGNPRGKVDCVHLPWLVIVVIELLNVSALGTSILPFAVVYKTSDI